MFVLGETWWVFSGIQEVVSTIGGWVGLLAAAAALWMKFALERLKHTLQQERDDRKQKVERELQEEKDGRAHEFSRELEHFRSQSAALLEQERAALARQGFVHQKQFEKEFEVYTVLWKALVKLKARTTELRPELDYVNPDENEEERKKKRLGGFREAYNDLRGIVHDNRPFYSQAVNDLAIALVKIAFKEALQYQSKVPDGMDYWEAAAAHIDRIEELIEEICSAVRGRIQLKEDDDT